MVGSGGMFCHTGLREKALGDRRQWLNVFSRWTAREGSWRSSGVAECFVTLDCARRHLLGDRREWRSV